MKANKKEKTKMPKPNSRRCQLNIRLTPAQDQMLRQKAKQANITKTQLITDLLMNTPIYTIPEFTEILQQIKYLGNKTNELSKKLDEKNLSNEQTKKLITNLQQGCDTLWQSLKSLKQAAPKQP